jgi:tRNA(Ile)-lysidine synthase
MQESPQTILGRFQDKINALTGAVSGCRVLLAVSGGVDSMVMVRLFSLSGKTFGLAHCNFSLRGIESDLDQQLVKQTALMLGVPFNSATFNTQEYAIENKLSIQEAARDLRYQWLQEIAFEHHYDLIATAHHFDDSIETLLINLLRGTGLKGLTGIPEKRENIIRPLLFATRAEIERFATEQNIEFRTDQSNEEDKYLRNRIRHHVVPVLKELNPSFNESMQDFFSKMGATYQVLQAEISRRRTECIFPEREGFSISIKKLLALPHAGFFLYEFLKEQGFSFAVCNDLLKSLKGQAGTQFFSKTHVAIKDRKKVFVKPLAPYLSNDVYTIFEDTQKLQTVNAFFVFEIKAASAELSFNQGEHLALLDYGRLEFPLLLRKTLPGDRMTPLGMKGSKKVSDLLTDLKVPRHKKQETWVLVSGSEIAWLAGYRISDKFKIRAKSKKVFTAKINWT